MSMPFFKNLKTIDTIGRITAIAAVIIFIISCSLDLYSYSITPTATPTPSNTPTVTRTPRPTITASATRSPLTETPQPTSSFPESEFFQGVTVDKILDSLIQKEYACEESSFDEASSQYRFVCQKTSENTLESILILSFDQVQINLITADLQKSETASDVEIISVFENIGEIILTQINVTEKETAFTATPSLTPQNTPQSGFELENPDEIERYKTWLTDILTMVEAENPARDFFAGIPFSLYRSNNHLWLEIGYITEDE